MVYFPGDDLFAASRPRGLPIGNLTSQFWANCYLNPLDHFVKRELNCRAYLRFVDDFLLFADDKAHALCLARRHHRLPGRLRLTLHESRCQPRPVSEGIPFLGFVVYPHHRRLKRRKGIAYRRRLRRAAARLPPGGEVAWTRSPPRCRAGSITCATARPTACAASSFADHPIVPSPRKR